MKNIIFILMILLNSCVDTPHKVENDDLLEGSILVLCEGQDGRNNASLTIFNEITNVSNSQFYEDANGGNLKLGDTANDIELLGDTAFVALTGSGVIEAFDINTGKYLGRIHLEKQFEFSSPRHIKIVNDTTAFVTSLYRHSLFQFNPKSIKFIKEIPNIGFYPEELDYYDGKLYIANSCLGDYYLGHPLSSKITIYDIQIGKVTGYFTSGPNTVEISINHNTNKLYSIYYNSSDTATYGGIVEFDLATGIETRRVESDCISLFIDEINNKLYCINQPRANTVKEKKYSNISFIDLNHKDFTLIPLINNSNIWNWWYSIYIYQNKIFIGNAKNFSVNGEVLCYDINTKEKLFSFACGVNPNNFIIKVYEK